VRNEERAYGIEQHADAHPGPAPFGQRGGELVGDAGLLEDVLDERDRRASAADCCEHRREELVPVLENLNTVPGPDRRACVGFDGRMERRLAEGDAREIVRGDGVGASGQDRETEQELLMQVVRGDDRKGRYAGWNRERHTGLPPGTALEQAASLVMEAIATRRKATDRPPTASCCCTPHGCAGWRFST
jgi:hypothetical protein